MEEKTLLLTFRLIAELALEYNTRYGLTTRSIDIEDLCVLHCRNYNITVSKEVHTLIWQAIKAVLERN